MSWFILIDWTTSTLEYESTISDGQPQTIFVRKHNCHKVAT